VKLERGGRFPFPRGEGLGEGLREALALNILIRPTIACRETGVLWSATFSLREKGSPTYIAVSEPWPFGVFMPSQVPLATYFQWPGS
jgi:hypothetical protein